MRTAIYLFYGLDAEIRPKSGVPHHPPELFIHLGGAIGKISLKHRLPLCSPQTVAMVCSAASPLQARPTSGAELHVFQNPSSIGPPRKIGKN